MSQQKKARYENQMEIVKQNQNLLAAAGISGKPQLSIFKMIADCWYEVFDFLSMEDVHSFGQTCKAFQQIAGEYFQWKYGAVTACCDGIYIGGKR